MEEEDKEWKENKGRKRRKWKRKETVGMKEEEVLKGVKGGRVLEGLWSGEAIG